ncbi:fatty acyl-CoA reductase 2, chloroplastic [Daucus carota subsp. sativus]|uniref:fatty acyl-CoA reductase 2, chloroplastic n=1 Tax=Daucus carota subsp. sativus TaxID=79200 RepID=UPI0007EFCB0A|nr:PREDICTED: fatty acyl-CoA reductase 2-like [Daucus carota subsp. sativus]
MTALQTALVLRPNSNGSSSFHKYYRIRKYNLNETPLLKPPLPCPKKNMLATTRTAAAAYKDYSLHEGGSGATTIRAPPDPSHHFDKLHGAGGIGVLEFLRGKNYLVTGATGFLAKVLIEKLLRTTPEVGKIYVLIRAKDQQAAAERLRNEIIDSELFKSLEGLHGKSYKTFMLAKLIPVAGNVCESDIGIKSNLAAEIAQVVNVIVNSSANTTFDERYDVAVNTNTRGPCRVLALAKKCKNLCLFLHVSTAYITGESGIIPENPIQIGQKMRNQVSQNEVDIEAEVNLALQSKEASEVASTPLMKALGLQRAKKHGWNNTYAFTKAMGEMLLTNQRGNVPVVIIRPSVIESAYKEPLPGWIEGNRMMDPVILFYGKGQLPGFLANPKAAIDIVPVDMVVNTILVAMAKHGRDAKPELNVYHVASSVSNPILLYDFFKYTCDHFKSSPLIDRAGKKIRITDIKFLSSLSDFSSYISSEIIERSGLMDDQAMPDEKLIERIKTKCEKLETILLHMVQLYEPYMFYTGWFDNGKVKALMKLMSVEEKMLFECDVGIIDWKEYICNIHIPGFRNYVLKGK